MLYVSKEMQEHIEDAMYWSFYEREHEAQRAAWRICLAIEAHAEAQVVQYLASHRSKDLKTQERAEDFACRYADRMAHAFARAIKDGYKASKPITKPHAARVREHLHKPRASAWRCYQISPALVRAHQAETGTDALQAWRDARDMLHGLEQERGADYWRGLKDAQEEHAETLEPRAVLVNQIRAICPRASLSHGGEWKPRARNDASVARTAKTSTAEQRERDKRAVLERELAQMQEQERKREVFGNINVHEK